MPKPIAEAPLHKVGGWLGAVLLAVAAGATLWLSLHAIFKIAMPGCGPGSPCDQASQSVWGSIPVVQWPVAFVGFAYFTAALVAWMVSGRRGVGALRVIALFGGLISGLFLVVTFVTGLFCPYCVVANFANLAFVGVMLAMGAPVLSPGGVGGKQSSFAGKAAGSGWAMPAGIATFALVTIVLGVGQQATRTTAHAKSEQARAEDAAKMVERAKAAPAEGSAATSPATAGGAGAEAAATIERPAAPPAAPFTGRWRKGPEVAPVRIVVFTDYQCSDCKIIEAQVEEILAREAAESPRVSLSIKHFPFCTACNPKAPNLHANACWAARAAEAAGALYGNEGFWKMTEWLFARGGSFTDAELDAGLRQLGFDRSRFLQVMQGPDTLRLVQADIAEGWDLGLYRTPMIFINGVELRGWLAPGAVTRTVNELLSAGLPARGPDADRPPAALAKYIQDWRESPVVSLAADPARPFWGDGAGATRVVMWGDLQEPGTCEADTILRALSAARPGVRYEYRHWPFNRACNPEAPRDQFAKSCLAALAAEAGGFMHGADGYRRTHEWLVNNRERLSEQALRDGLPALGIEGDEFFLTMESPDLSARIAADARAGKALGITGLPSIYVNGRLIPRWKLGERSIIAEVLDAAARDAPR